MIYAVSDFHGCYDKYKALLEKLNLQPEDRLYVLGDVVDRGPDGLKILLDMVKRENVTLLRGNHDETAALILGSALDENCRIKVPGAEEAVAMWLSDGGMPTLEQFFRTLGAEEQKAVLNYIENAPEYAVINVNGKNHLLAHSIPEIEDFEALGGMRGLDSMDFSFNETDYDACYDENVVMVSGHTPTWLIDPACKGRIWKGNNHIAIDCGAVFGNPLGCICLTTGKEFYV